MLKSWCPNGTYNVGFLDLEYNSHDHEDNKRIKEINTGLDANKVRVWFWFDGQNVAQGVHCF